MRRAFPGTVAVQGREFLFLESEGPGAFRELFPRITKSGPSPLPSSGGAINEEAAVVLPGGKRLHGLSFRGDLLGWRRKVIECAETHGLLWGQIVGQSIRLSDGNVFDLSNCLLEM
jgi:hypothetical protein